MGRVLVHDRDAGVVLEENVRVEDLEQSRCQVLGVRCQGFAGKDFERRARAADTWHLKPDTCRLDPYTLERSRRAERREGPAHTLFHDALDEELVAKPHFELGRVHVHVDRVARKLEEQEQ